MRHRSRSAAPATGTILGLTQQNRRRHFRHTIRRLAYLKVDSTNGGVLRDVSEFGVATQPLAALHLDQRVQLQIDLPGPHLQFAAEGRVVWTDPSGQAGIEFLELVQPSRHLLKEWIFAQLLAEAARSAGNTAQLLFSAPSRPAIRLDEAALRSQRRLAQQHQFHRLRLLWVPLSLRGFSVLVDGLVLLCAVLLFSVVALTLTDTLPPWPVASLLELGVAAIFAALYWFLFSMWFGITPGRRLAELACRDAVRRRDRGEEDRARFR
jgi:hypothetical protein